MLAFAIVIIVGVLLGAARGGSIRRLSSERLALVPLVWAAAALQIAAQFIPHGWTMVAYGAVIVSYAALFAFAGANWRVPGMILLAVGAAMNYVVILANQGMPISAEAAAQAGFVGEEAQRLVLRGKHVVAASSDIRLAPLGDVIPLWRQPAVASAGDLVIWAGLIVVVQALMQPAGRAAGPAVPRPLRAVADGGPEVSDEASSIGGRAEGSSADHLRSHVRPLPRAGEADRPAP